MKNIIKVFITIGLLLIAVFITFTILTLIFMGKYLEQYHEWIDE